MSGRVYGQAGAGVATGDWVANEGVRKAGATGEVKTAELLNRLARDKGVTVMHDLLIPIPGITANIDHVVVTGRQVLIIDSKAWKPGFLWTLGGKTFRGFSRFASADKRTMVMARESLTRYLAGTRAKLAWPLLAVWPTNQHKNLSLWAVRVQGARVVNAARLETIVSKMCRGEADPTIEALLANLVINVPVPAPRRSAWINDFGSDEF